MPFEDGRFDAIWSVWVLEHVPNPEAALREMRRVVADRGLLFLARLGTARRGPPTGTPSDRTPNWTGGTGS